MAGDWLVYGRAGACADSTAYDIVNYLRFRFALSRRPSVLFSYARLNVCCRAVAGDWLVYGRAGACADSTAYDIVNYLRFRFALSRRPSVLFSYARLNVCCRAVAGDWLVYGRAGACADINALRM